MHDAAPALLRDRKLHAGSFLLELVNGGLHVVAHQIELMGRLFGGVDRNLGRRQREDQPPPAGVYRVEAQDIPEKVAVGVRVAAEENDVRAADHEALFDRRRISPSSASVGIAVTFTSCSALIAHPVASRTSSTPCPG